MSDATFESALSHHLHSVYTSEPTAEVLSRTTALAGHALYLGAVAARRLPHLGAGLRETGGATTGRTLTGSGARDHTDAAFLNGLLIHAMAQDDTLVAARTHVTACALPA